LGGGFLGREFLGRGFFFVQFFLVVQRGECTKSARSSPGILGRAILGRDYLGRDYLGGGFCREPGILKTLVDFGVSVLST
jgi:hypothetical protein